MSARLVTLIFWLLAAVLALGITPLAKKMALDEGDAALSIALLIAFSTTLISGVLVFIWLTAKKQLVDLKRLSKKDWRAVLVVGALGSGLVPLLGIIAMIEASASNRALFQSAYPVATAIAARLILHERLNVLSYLWIGLIFIGLLLVNVQPDAGLASLNWTFWPLLATLPLIGISDVIAKKALSDLQPEIIAFGRALGGVLVLFLLVPWMFTSIATTEWQTWLWVLVAGACMGVFAVALYQVFDRTLATVAASLIALAPLLTLVLEVSLLSLELDLLQWSGFVLVLISVLLLLRKA
uniref:DMT family transporter n=1 Tax=Ningiella ruwaisensis TaxID=2364274 RepID=UPI0010A08CB3|nr:DMT family transporter [Ningiella ruwaisensis]